MNIGKEWVGKILIFTFGEVYDFDEYHYFSDTVMKNGADLPEILNAQHIIMDCTKLKGIVETDGEIFSPEKI